MRNIVIMTTSWARQNFKFLTILQSTLSNTRSNIRRHLWLLWPYYKEADPPNGLNSYRQIAVCLPVMWHIQHEGTHSEVAHDAKAQSKNCAGESHNIDFKIILCKLCVIKFAGRNRLRRHMAKTLIETSVVLQLAA